MSARKKFDSIMAECDESISPLERLRFFCSLAMSGQDWLDVELLFADVDAAIKDDRRDSLRYRWLRQGGVGAKIIYVRVSDNGVFHAYLAPAEELDAAADAAIAEEGKCRRG